MRVCLLSAAAVVSMAPPAGAHHGRDFLSVQAATVPHRGQLVLLSDQALRRSAGESLIDWSPGALLGLSRRLAIEVHGHLEREPHEGWVYEATAGEALLVLTPPEPGRTVRLALSAEYEVGQGEHHDRLAARAIVGFHRAHSTLTINVGPERGREDDARTGWSYAVGFRPNLEGRLDWGLEVTGALDDDAEREGHEALFGLYAQPWERLTVKAGVGRGFSGAPDWSFRTGVVLTF